MPLEFSTTSNRNTTLGENSSPLSSLPKKNSEVVHLEAELRLTLEEIARLQNSLAEANMKNTALQASLESQPVQLDGSQVLRPVLQELKGPLHTIQGYLDLLSGESVGILGTFQKRFLERISTSVDQMGDILKKLDAETATTSVDQTVFMKSFSIVTVIEETLALYAELIRNKAITLKVAFEEEDFPFVGDQESFERVLNILFTNGFNAISEEGIITIGLKILKGKKTPQLLLSIQSGGLDSPKSRPLPVNLNEFKDMEIKLEGFGANLKDLVKAEKMIEEMQGKMEIFSIPSSGSLIRLRLPVNVTPA